MPPQINDINKALDALNKFREYTISPNHERFIFPFLCGSYFTYRKIDVVRIFAIAKTISENPTYLDVGCGYGDFLEKIREYIPNAEGIEKSAEIFYSIGKVKPDYIKIADAYNGIEKKYDIIFVGWMEPGVDYRDQISAKTEVIITTLDQGLSLAAEFDGHGFDRIASWATPSWEDINIEITNRYYSKIPNELIQKLADLRGAHNLWYVYCRPKWKKRITNALKLCLAEESEKSYGRYEFETVLDDAGYKYFEKIKNPFTKYKLWDPVFDFDTKT
jgi:SAM-dependent methyltransferase